MNKITTITAVGPASFDRAIFCKFLAELLVSDGDRDRLEIAEMREIIEWGRGLQTNTGNELRRLYEYSLKGHLLPDTLIDKLFQIWFEETRDVKHNAKLFIISGLPRTTQQIVSLQYFERRVTIHIEATKEETIQDVKQRVKQTPPEKLRPYDVLNQQVVEQRWNGYVNHTKVMVQQLNRSTINLRKCDPLVQRLRDTIRMLTRLSSPPVSHEKLYRAADILKNPQHPITRRIMDLDHSEVHPESVLVQ